jgi:hypothetical protein
MDRRAVLVEHNGEWLTGHVLWTYEEFGRRRALVRFTTPAGLRLRALHWADELRRPGGIVLEMTTSPTAEEETTVGIDLGSGRPTAPRDPG